MSVTVPAPAPTLAPAPVHVLALAPFCTSRGLFDAANVNSDWLTVIMLVLLLWASLVVAPSFSHSLVSWISLKFGSSLDGLIVFGQSVREG